MTDGQKIRRLDELADVAIKTLNGNIKVFRGLAETFDRHGLKKAATTAEEVAASVDAVTRELEAQKGRVMAPPEED